MKKQIKMYFRLKIITIGCLLSLCFVTKSIGQMPIIAYYGTTIEKMTLSEYNAMKDCGFTHSLNIYNTVDKAVNDLVIANQADVKLYIHTPQLLQNQTNTVGILKKYPALAGYFLADEPQIGEISKYVNIVNAIKRIDANHSCYINLHPYYNDNQMKSIGTKSYRTYLQNASQIGLPQISFDFYPITKDGLRSDSWFYTLNEIRRESLRTNVPFWGYVLSVPHNDYPQPTLAMLRLQVYVNLAYGAQAIQYFTYKLPTDKTYSFHDAPVDANGRKTKTYSLVKQMNSELKKVSSLFYGAKIESIGHLINIPSGCQKAKIPQNIKSLSVNGQAGAVVSVFTNNGHKYLAIVNKDYVSTMTLKITAKNNAVKNISKQLVENSLKSSYTVQPGDIVLFRLV